MAAPATPPPRQLKSKKKKRKKKERAAVFCSHRGISQRAAAVNQACGEKPDLLRQAAVMVVCMCLRVQT